MKKTFLASFVLFVASLHGAEVEFRLVPFNDAVCHLLFAKEVLNMGVVFFERLSAA